MPTRNVFFVRQSTERRIPDVNFKIRQNRECVDWPRVLAVLNGELPLDDYQFVRLVADWPRVEDWDLYYAGGPWLFSRRAADLLRPWSVQCFEFIEASLNNAPFFFLRDVGSIDCLDREASELVPFPHDPQRFMQIEKYGFRKDLIPDPVFFRIPELKGEYFCSSTVESRIRAESLKGISCEDAELSGLLEEHAPTALPGPTKLETWGRDRIPPTDEKLDALERRFGILLPKCYREFLLNYPPALGNAPCRGSCQERIGDLYCYDRLDRLVEANAFVREEPDIEWLDDGSKWPAEHFVIGCDGCGNYWTIDLSSHDRTVHFYDHDYGRFEPSHVSLKAFAEWLLQESRKPAADG